LSLLRRSGGDLASRQRSATAPDILPHIPASRWVLARLAPLLAIRRRGYLENRHDPALFAMRDLRKDLDLAVDLFGRSSAITPLTAVARDLFVAAAGTSPDLDITAAIRRYRGDEKSDR
jgi:3-hydroxyisobutyrate dehydrogenase-like beta-hydroxyacid dehydrogenase